MPPIFRITSERDAEQIQAIYAPIVRDTIISFELEPPSVAEMRQFILSSLATHAWLVCDNVGEILGYVYATQHRSRAAYQWAADVSVYIKEQTRRSGLGRALYTSLFELLRLQGFYQAYAGIALPNPASVGLHEALGFQSIGVYRSVGFKFGLWRDVGWWCLPLQTTDQAADAPPPRRPIDLKDVKQDSAEWQAALKFGLSLVRF